MPLRYSSGEEIQKGDRVLFHGKPAQVELVACTSEAADPTIGWYVKEFGGGIMILDPSVSGRTFISIDSLDDDEDLEFVSRGQV